VEARPLALDEVPTVVELSADALESSPIAVELAPTADDFSPTAVELSPLTVDPSPTAVDSTPVADEFTPHSVEAEPAPTTQVAVGPACATEAMQRTAELAVASNVRLNLDDIDILRRGWKKDARVQLCRRGVRGSSRE
jgi:hypothetical protein